MRANWHAVHANLLREIARLDHNQRFIRLTAGDPSLAQFADVPALLAHQHRGSASPEAKNDVLRTLVTAVQDGLGQPCAAQSVLLLALWPGHDAIRGRLARFRRDGPEELEGDILARALDAAARMDLARVNRVAATLLRNVERDLRRTMQTERARAAGAIPIDLRDDATPIAEPLLAASLPGAEAILDAGRLRQRLRRVIGTDAGLVMAVAVEGFTQTEAGAVMGIGHAAARKRYQRAVARLQCARELF